MIRASFAVAALALVASGFAQTRPHDFDLLDVRWTVKLDDTAESLSGEVTNTLLPKAGAKAITLDCGASLQIDTLTVDGATATYRHDGHLLEIDLPRASTKPIAVNIRYHGKPEAGVYFVPAKRAFPAKTPVVYTQGEMEDNRYWLPTYDYPDDKATSEGRIDVPEGWFALSNGKLLDQKTANHRTSYHWKMDQAHATYLISFVAGPYEKGHEVWDGTPVDFYVPKGLLDQGQAAFGGTADIVRFYSRLTGFRYPYAKYSQAAVPDYMFGGMENITCTTQTIGALHPPTVSPLDDTTGLVAHELAHQWFGDTVTCSGWSDAWINEGWASFLPIFYVREKRGQEAFDLERYDTFQGGLAAHRYRPDRPVVWKGYTDALEMFDNFIYPGGASRMFMLMHQVGEDKFWKATQAYLQERKYTSFDTPAFFDSYSRNLGMDLKPFMNQWFYTNGAPTLTVSREGSNLVVTQKAPYFELDTEVGILKAGSLVRRKVHLTGERTTLDLGSDAERPLLLDPDCWLMANIESKLTLSLDDRIALLEASNGGEQARILDSMLGDLSPAQALDFAKKMHSNRLLGRFLFRLGEGAQPFLLELTKGKDRALASNAVSRLGDLPASEASRKRLDQLLKEDPNPAIRNAAYQALMKSEKDGKLAEWGWKTDGYRDAYRTAALEWWHRHQPEVARERALEALAKDLPEPTRVNAIRVLGQLKDKAGERRVFEALAAVLRETSFGAKNTAIGALAEYGDPAAIPLIEPLAKAQLVFFRQSSRSALERLHRKS